MQRVSLTTARPAASLTAARLSFAAGITAFILLAALHFLSPELDPSWRMVSEYALGGYGWVLSLMFLAWGVSSLALFFAIRSQIRTVGGKIGLGFLALSGAGASLSAFFDVSHNLHALAALLGIPTFPIAALLISASLGRSPAWTPARRPLMWAANLTWMSLLLLLAMLLIGLSQTGGKFGPDVLIGWPNRLVAVADWAWLLAAARRAIQVDTGE